MTAASTLCVEPAGESGGHCDCCGNETRTIWGYIYDRESPYACYFVEWTRHRPEHFPNVDFLIGNFANEAEADGTLVSWLYNRTAESFMAIDSGDRPAAKSPLCARALTRDEVVADAEEMEAVTSLIDAIWLGDPRISEVMDLSNDA